MQAQLNKIQNLQHAQYAMTVTALSEVKRRPQLKNEATTRRQ